MMPHSSAVRCVCRVAGTLAAMHLAELVLAQPVLLESAQLGSIGRIAGTSITTVQFPGWRFEVDRPIAVDSVGGHLLAYPDAPGDIFAAIIRLPSIDALPQGAPFRPEETVVTTTFRPPFPSNEVMTPLSATLRPGAYALVFGTGLFGATSEGAIHNGPDQPDIAPTNISSYIFWGLAFPNQPPLWRTNLASNMRFVVAAHAINLPGDYNLDGDVDAEDYELWRTDFASSQNLAADGNGNSIVDAADYVIWREHFGTTVDSAVAATASIPEPSCSLSLCVALSMLVARRYDRGTEPNRR